MRISTLLILLSVVAWMPSSAAILNPSFEIGIVNSVPVDWTAGGSVQFEANKEPDHVNGLPTDGSYSGRIYRRSTTGVNVTVGDYGTLFQVVDLTNITSITFDASLDQYDGTEQNAWSSARIEGSSVSPDASQSRQEHHR